MVAVDLFLTESSRRAHVVFPALAFGEVEGTVTNLEGRVQKVNRLVPGPGQARPAVEVFEDLSRLLGHPIGAGAPPPWPRDRRPPGLRRDHLGGPARGAGRDGLPAATPVPYDLPLEAPLEESGDMVLHLGRVLYDRGTAVQQGRSLAGLAPAAVLRLHPDDSGPARGSPTGPPCACRAAPGRPSCPPP